MCRQDGDGRKTNKNIDDAGNNCFLTTEQHSYVPLKQPDEKPVKAADYKQCERNIMKCFHDWINSIRYTRPFYKYSIKKRKASEKEGGGREEWFKKGYTI